MRTLNIHTLSVFQEYVVSPVTEIYSLSQVTSAQLKLGYKEKMEQDIRRQLAPSTTGREEQTSPPTCQFSKLAHMFQEYEVTSIGSCKLWLSSLCGSVFRSQRLCRFTLGECGVGDCRGEGNPALESSGGNVLRRSGLHVSL